MHRRGIRPHSALAVLTLLLVAVFAAPSLARAITPGTGGWYWPVGTEDFQGWDGWWVYRCSNHSWHMAQDMPAPVGHPVYAVGDGTVIESQADAGYGGVLVVLHHTATGEPFKAVYGHVRRAPGTGVGAKVKAGQVIGYVNDCRHVHFGIHPGQAYPPDNNPYRGHTYDRSKTYGWVDSVAYLRTHARSLAYAAPALPEILVVPTDTTATVLGVAEGRVYWTVGSDAPCTTFSRSMGATDTLALPEGEALPSLDATSFPAHAAQTSFSLLDARPSLCATVSTTAPLSGCGVHVSGRLTNAVGAAFVGASVIIETSPDGCRWTCATTARSGLTGAFVATFIPARRVAVRARFLAPAPYMSARSVEVTVAPRPAVSVPLVPAYITSRTFFAARGTLAPRHAAGSGSTLLRFQRLVSHSWIDAASATTRYADVRGGSAYSASLRLRAGTWRVRAETPADDAHSSRTTAWRAFTVH